MAGFLTKDRYTCATVFVDHNSNLSYLHFQKSTSAKYTLEAKKAFERFSRQRGVWIRNYHADNGTFAGNNWVRNIMEVLAISWRYRIRTLAFPFWW